MREFFLRGLPTFLKHLGLLMLGASGPTLSLIAGSGVEHLSVHDLWQLLDAEQAAAALALLAWLTPLSGSYGVGGAKAAAAVLPAPVVASVSPAPGSAL